MRELIIQNRGKLSNNKGSGLGVILYGITLLLVLVFVAINIVNSKMIEEGYNSLRDAVQTAASGSVIHLLTADVRENKNKTTSTQSDTIKTVNYDIYLQLALGYLINRNPEQSKETYVQTGEINNFIKINHKEAVNTTLTVFNDAILRNKGFEINNTDKYKIMMFFIEPYRTDDGKKYFDIVAYGNGGWNGNVERQLAKTAVGLNDEYSNMALMYKAIENSISSIINCTGGNIGAEDKMKYDTGTSYSINLNSTGSSDYNDIIRKMETYPHYLIVIKDFALPTIFGDTNESKNADGESWAKRLFKKPVEELSGNGKLKQPMCALNTGKIERQYQDAGWDKRR